MGTLQFINKVISRVETWLIVIFLSSMVLFTFLQVCLRSLYTHANIQWANDLMGQLDWSEPLVRLLVLWVTFLGASLLTADNRHINIDLFSRLLPQNWRPVRDFLLSVAALFISSIMIKVCITYVGIEMKFGGAMFLKIPGWIGQLILPLGFALISFRFLIQSIFLGCQIVGGKST